MVLFKCYVLEKYDLFFKNGKNDREIRMLWFMAIFLLAKIGWYENDIECNTKKYLKTNMWGFEDEDLEILLELKR